MQKACFDLFGYWQMKLIVTHRKTVFEVHMKIANYFHDFVFCRAVWAVANGDYVEAHAAQAVVVQYPFKSLSLSCLLFCLCQHILISCVNFAHSVSHTDVNFFLCGLEYKNQGFL